MPLYEQWGHTFSKTIDLKIKLQVEKSQKHNQSLPKRSNSRKKEYHSMKGYTIEVQNYQFKIYPTQQKFSKVDFFICKVAKLSNFH